VVASYTSKQGSNDHPNLVPKSCHYYVWMKDLFIWLDMRVFMDTAFRDWDYADMLELANLEYLWSILNCFGQGSHLNLHAGAKEYKTEPNPQNNTLKEKNEGQK